jgi:hypothetical protein
MDSSLKNNEDMKVEGEFFGKRKWTTRREQWDKREGHGR